MWITKNSVLLMIIKFDHFKTISFRKKRIINLIKVNKNVGKYRKF